MFFKWKAFAAGALIGLLGWSVFQHALGTLYGGEARAPTGGEMALLALGSVVMLFGAFLAFTPNVVAFLRLFYGESFAPGVTCPVMVTCPSCLSYNVRARATCKACAGSLMRARGAGSERFDLGHAADQSEARERASTLVDERA